MANVRKYVKTVTMPVSTSAEVRNKLIEIAEEKNISRNDLLNDIINSYLNRIRK